MELVVCQGSGCDAPAETRGYCNLHYQRWWRTGDPDLLKRNPYQADKCQVEGCDRQCKALDYCGMHYQRFKKGGSLDARPKAPNGAGYTDPHNGYRQVQINGRKLLEHRWVMEQHLGRQLRSDENIHHRNGVRHDNRIENLELCTSLHPHGQRVVDQVAWAKEILARYEEDVSDGLV